MKLKLKLAHKIMLLVFVVLVVSIIGVTIVSTTQGEKHLVEVAKADLSHLTNMAVEICKANAAQLEKLVEADLRATSGQLQTLSKGTVVAENGEMILDPDGRRIVMNNNTEFVDGILTESGAYCTIFLKEGSTARRIATSVKNEDGSRAVGTYISQPVYDAVIARGQTYHGRAWVVNAWQVTAYEPIRNPGGEIIGSLFCGVPERSDLLRNALLSQKVGTTGYMYTMDTKAVLQVHPAKEGTSILSNDFAKEMVAKAPQLKDGEIAWVIYPWINKELGETEARDKIVAYAYFPEWDWIVAAGSYLDEFTAPVSQMRNAIMLLGFVALLISLGIAWFIARSIVRPVLKLVTVANAVAVGDVNRDVDIKATDEVGVLANAFQELIDYMKHLAGAAERIAANDLTVDVAPKSDKDVLGNSFKTMVNNLTGMVRQLGSNASELVSAATEIASSSEEMSRGAKDQASQMGQVSTAIEEMSATIVESSKNAGDASDGARVSAEVATAGGDVVTQTIAGMQRITKVVRESANSIAQLAKSADQIGEIIGVIDDIADQTNLLALNAAIEAARAGEQGRGFAVVADEVRKLAERTGKATGEITEMIKGVQTETQDAVRSMESGIQQVDQGRELADKAGNSLAEVVSGAQRVMDMIAQIATATEEQSAAAEQISKSIESIAAISRETAKGVEESATAAEQLNRQAEGLQRMVAQFKLKD